MGHVPSINICLYMFIIYKWAIADFPKLYSIED